MTPHATRRPRAAFIGLACALILAGALAAPPAQAGAGGCAAIAVDVSGSVRDRLPALARSVADALVARDDIDRCARVAVGADGAALVVRVTLADGRTAARSVARSEDVVPTLVALLLLPERPQPAVIEPAASEPAPAQLTVTATAAPAAKATAVTATAAAQPDVANAADAAANARDGHGIRIELGLATGGRAGDGQAGVGVGALSFVEARGWLVGFEGRIDGYQRLGGSGEAPTGALELALLGGRRLRSATPGSTLALDLVAGVGLALQWMYKSVHQAGSSEPDVTTSASRTEARLRLGARLGFRALSTFRPFIAVDGDLGLGGQSSTAGEQGDLPPLPSWTVGLAVGATVGTR